jgi:monoamine oxidase
MTDSSSQDARTFLRQTGAGTLELVKPSMAKSGKARLVSSEIPDVKTKGKGETIVILGAGVAGLTLAYQLLRDTSYNVTILEAQNRVGGRSLTLRPGDTFTEVTEKFEVTQKCEFDDKGVTGTPYLNAGPGRIPSCHRNVLNYCKALGVDLEVYVMESRSNLMCTLQGFGGEPVVDRRLANDPRGYFAEYLYQNSSAFLKYMNSRPQEKALGSGDIDDLKVWLKSFGSLDEEGKYVGSSRSGYVVLPLTEDGVIEPPLPFKDILDSGFWNLNFYQPEDYHWQTTSFQPVGGMDMIVHALYREVKKMGGKVELKAPVTKIERRGDAWGVSFGDHKTIVAHKCISNIPMPLLKGKVQEKDFSKDYWAALDQIMDCPTFLQATCKVGWQSDRKYWQDPEDNNEIPIFGGISRIDTDRMDQMWYPSNDYHDNTGILTGAYNYHEDAELWGEHKPEFRMDEARRGAKKLHGEDFSKQLRNGVSIAWQNIPAQRGGWVEWSELEAGASEESKAATAMLHRVKSALNKDEPKRHSSEWCYNQLQKEDSGFFVTGDQVSQMPGWQEGAMGSALQIFGMLNHPDHIMPLKVYRVPNTRALVTGR